MKIGKTIAWIGLIAMSAGLMNGFMNGDFFKDGAELLANPWGVMSMVDLYVGFTLFSMWIVFREKSVFGSVIWIVLMMFLGFFTACLYLLINFYTCKEDWATFFFGARKNQVLK